MDAQEFVPKNWIISPTARRVYRMAAVVSLTLYLFIAAIVLNEPLRLPKSLLFVAVLATALNLIAMEFFLFHFDDSPALMQMVWFCALIFFPLGPALYCFIVYSRSKAVKTAGTERANETSG